MPQKPEYYIVLALDTRRDWSIERRQHWNLWNNVVGEGSHTRTKLPWFCPIKYRPTVADVKQHIEKRRGFTVVDIYDRNDNKLFDTDIIMGKHSIGSTTPSEELWYSYYTEAEKKSINKNLVDSMTNVGSKTVESEIANIITTMYAGITYKKNKN